MTVNNQPQEAQAPVEKKEEDKAHNFELMRRRLEKTEAARLEAEQRLAQLEKQLQQKQQSRAQEDEDEYTDEPYVDHRRLKKELNKVAPKIKEETLGDVRQLVRDVMQQERQALWMKNNPDYYDVMQHAQRLADKDPELAETILEMPEGFERNKLVYKNIKAFELHKKPEERSSIQEKIDRNKQHPGYQPTGVSPGANGMPFISGQRDYSPDEGRAAIERIKQIRLARGMRD